MVQDINFYSCFGLENSPPDYDLFEALNSLMNIEKIDLFVVNLSLIPERAFRQKMLKIFSFYRNYYQQFTIGDYAFYECDQLNFVGIGYTNMNYISKNMFNIKNPSQTRLYLDLRENNFDGSSFDSEAFLNTKRPTHIDLSGNKINYIDKSVFLRFLTSNIENTVEFGFFERGQIDCYGCRSHWIMEYKDKYESRMRGWCLHNYNISIWDESNFINCKGNATTPCPPPESVYPCSCVVSESSSITIQCMELNDYIMSIFQNLSNYLRPNETHFDTFFLKWKFNHCI